MQAFLIEDSDETTKGEWAWRLAACERGFECGLGDPLLEYACRFDQLCTPDENAIVYMKRILQADYPAVEDQAREISSDLDAGRWSAFDFGG
jgi:hypothetical protein